MMIYPLSCHVKSKFDNSIGKLNKRKSAARRHYSIALGFRSQTRKVKPPFEINKEPPPLPPPPR